MKSGKHTPFIRRVLVLAIVVALLALVGLLWWADAVSPVDSSDLSPVVFTVGRGESGRSIATRLTREGLIRSPTGFFVMVKILGIEKNLQAGLFRLNRSMNSRQVAEELTHGSLDVWVTILEGWRVEEIATKLARELDVPEAEFLKHAEEGSLFPDTYLIPKDSTPEAIAAMLRENFDRRITGQMREDAKKSRLRFDEVITLASIVEREGRTDEDRPVIAGILLKRLKAGMALQADATLQYALGYQPEEKSWWKKFLTSDDKAIRSPYNTYRNPGLPPGPIANPGLASIKAVIYPTESEYWYYLHDKAGGVHYGRTLEEHNANVARYL